MTIFEKLASIAAKHAPAERFEGIVNRKGAEATLYLYEEITPEGMGGISAKQFAAAMKDAEGAKTLHLRINSIGGTIYEAKAIYQALKDFPGKKVAHVDGLAASAASFIAMACDEIITAPDATWFVHGAQGVTMGSARAHRHIADILDMESANIANIYARRTGQPLDVLNKLMDDNTFMTAQEAKGYGFTDSIAGEEAPSSKVKNEAPAQKITSLAAETQRRITEARLKHAVSASRNSAPASGRNK